MLQVVLGESFKVDLALPLEFEFSPKDIGLDCRLGILRFLTASDGLSPTPSINIEVDIPFTSDLINAHDYLPLLFFFLLRFESVQHSFQFAYAYIADT